MDFYVYYLYKGYSLYARSEDGLFHYDRKRKKWISVEDGWDPEESPETRVIDPERAARFF